MFGHVMSHLIGYLLLAGVTIWAGFVYCRFRKAEGTCLERFASSAQASLTNFVNYLTAAALALGNGILMLSDAFNMPEVRTAIETNLTPATATGLIAGIVILNVVARFRTLGKQE